MQGTKAKEKLNGFKRLKETLIASYGDASCEKCFFHDYIKGAEFPEDGRCYRKSPDSGGAPAVKHYQFCGDFVPDLDELDNQIDEEERVVLALEAQEAAKTQEAKAGAAIPLKAAESIPEAGKAEATGSPQGEDSVEVDVKAGNEATAEERPPQ